MMNRGLSADDIEGSMASCTQVANYLFDNYMRPTRGQLATSENT